MRFILNTAESNERPIRKHYHNNSIDRDTFSVEVCLVTHQLINKLSNVHRKYLSIISCGHSIRSSGTKASTITVSRVWKMSKILRTFLPSIQGPYLTTQSPSSGMYLGTKKF